MIALKPSLLSLALILPAALLLAEEPGAPEPNLVRNPGLEGEGANGLPAGWTAVTIGAPAQLAVDASDPHGGRQSVRITASEVARSYVQSEAIEVAPGEKLRIGAWVKAREVPPDQGTVIAIADFETSSGAKLPAMKVGTADVKAPEWRPIAGTMTVPETAVRLRLRLGFSYSRGTCWWDDVTVRAEQPLVARIELPGARLSPALGGVPVGIVNRSRRRGALTLTVAEGAATRSESVELTGEPLQRAIVPLQITKRGKETLTLAVSDGAQTLFSESRSVTVPPPLTLSPLIPTHWVTEEGDARVQADLALEVAPEECRAATLVTRVLDSAGTPRATVATAPVRPGSTSLSLRASGLGEGEYRVESVFQPADGAPVKAQQPWAVIPRRKAQVKLNAAGYLEQEGKAVFPLGIFNGGARMAEAGACGFTVSHAYNAVRVVPGTPPDDQRAKDFLDSTGKAGMKALFLVPMPWAVSGDWEAFRRRIRMFRNHPALLAWDEEEGLARGDMKPETLVKLREVLREEDPHHPLMVGDARDVIGRVTDRTEFFPHAQMDLGMWWWYPFPLNARGGDALQGEETARGDELVPPTFLAQKNSDRPLWVGVQAYKKPAANGRYPNAAEYRAQAYLGLISGARGLMWYGGSVQGGLFLSPQEGDWEALKGLVRELSGLSEEMMGRIGPAPTISPDTSRVSAAVKQGKTRRLLLAVNRGRAPVEVSLKVAGPVPASVVAIGESRSVRAAEGAIRDRFGPYAAHVYDLGP